MGETAKKMPLFFNVQEAGGSIEEMAVDIIKSEGYSLTSHWYHSPLEVDIYVWFDEKKNIIKQQISICGQICEWNIIEGVRTGFVFEVGDEEENKESSIRFDKFIHQTSLHQALNLLKYSEKLPTPIKVQLIYNFEQNPMADNLDPQELLAQYGDKAKDLKGNLAKFFKKLFK